MAPAIGFGIGIDYTKVAGGASPPTARVPPAYFAVGGTSLVANGGGVAAKSGGSFTMSRNMSTGYAGTLPEAVGNAFKYIESWNFGAGATSSLNLLDRLNTTSTYAVTAAGAGSNPAGAITGIASDYKNNQASTGQYSPVTEPSPGFILFMEANDVGSAYYSASSPTFKTTLQTAASTLDTLIAAGKTDILLATGHLKSGKSYVALEAKTVAGATCTATNTAGFVDGETIGVCGVMADNGTSDIGVTRLTKVASAPAAGQYSVSAGGVYTFNAASPPVKAYLTYAYGTNTIDSTYANLFNHWAKSSDANFVDPLTGNNYGIPGALYGRQPIVNYIDTFGGLTATGAGNTAAQEVGSLYDDLHPSFYGRHKMDLVFASEFARIYPGAVPVWTPPTLQNYKILQSAGVITNYSGGNALTMTALQISQMAGLLTAGSLRTVTLRLTANSIGDTNTAAITIPDVGGNSTTFSGSFALTVGGTPATYTITSGTLNYLTGAITLTTSPAFPVSYTLSAELDPLNLISNNGMLEAGAQLPALTQDGGTSAAVSAGKLTLTTGTGIDTDGYPYFDLTLSGHSGTGTSCTLSIAANGSKITRGNKLRAGGVVQVMAGPDGNLVGLSGAGTRVQVQGTGGITVDGNAGLTILLSRCGNSPAVPADNRSLTLESNMIRNMLTDPLFTQGPADASPIATITSATGQFVVGYTAGPVSFKVRFKRLWVGQEARTTVP